jgi:predicted GNAT superfamily acetyltransferase
MYGCLCNRNCNAIELQILVSILFPINRESSMCLYCHFLPLENEVRYKNISRGEALLKYYDNVQLTGTAMIVSVTGTKVALN